MGVSLGAWSLKDDGVAVAGQLESRALTGLRGFGALLVLLHHFYLHFVVIPLEAWPHVPFFWPLLRKGYLGVDLFFVLSGFVIAMVYGHWFRGLPWGEGSTGWPTHAPVFWLRRWARLWPLHAVVLAATVVPDMVWGGQGSVRTLIANAGMIQAWGISAEINSPAWSVSTEWLAYLVFPILAPLLLRTRWGLIVALSAVVGLLAVDMALAPHLGITRRGPLDLYYNYSVLPLLRCLAGFMFGMAAWRVGESPGAARLFSRWWLGPLALASMIAMMLGRVNDLLIYPLLPAIVLGFHFGRGAGWAIFARGPLYRLGVLSYAFYLVHFTLLHWFRFGWGPYWLELVVYLIETTAVAAVLHHAVERPARLLIRRWGEPLLARLLRPGQPMPLQGGPG